MDGFYDAGDVTGRMSDSEAQDASLLGHENKDAMQRWEKEKHNSARIYRLRSILLFWMLVVVVGFLLSAVLYLLRLQYRLTAISLQSGESTRDLKILLHPEDHVSRGPGVTRYLWNITKGNIAPDGVHKDVFLINSRSRCLIRYCWYPDWHLFRRFSRSGHRGTVWWHTWNWNSEQ